MGNSKVAISGSFPVVTWCNASIWSTIVALLVLAALFEPHSLSGGGYLNYPEVDQTAARVAAAFLPPSFEKLRRIKSSWDPDNRFRHNANIPPA